jgi:hypothetical protein
MNFAPLVIKQKKDDPPGGSSLIIEKGSFKDGIRKP